MNTDLQIPAMYSAEEMSSQLQKLLVSSAHFYYLYKHYHWNVLSQRFYSLHLMFDKHAEEIHETEDAIAERIRQMGVTVDFVPTDFSVSVLPLDNQDAHKSTLILDHLTRCHNEYITLLESIITNAGNQKDYASADLLTAFLETQQQQRWFVMSSNQQDLA
jgi:starvation-inducible DNA-binding protein